MKTAHVYRNTDGSTFTAHRDDEGGEKKCWQTGNTQGTPLPLDGFDPSKPILIVEGEKACDAARGYKLNATTWARGASNVLKTDWAELKGLNVILWPDNDKPGMKAMQELAFHLYGVQGCAISIVEVSKLPEKGDIADVPFPHVVAEILKTRRDWNPDGHLQGFDEAQFRVVKYLWKGWLPLGKVTLLVAQGGTGKSTFAAGHLAACVTNRKKWPDGTETEPGKTFFVIGEDGVNDMVGPRLKLSGADLEKCKHGAIESALVGFRLIVVDLVEVGLQGEQSGMRSGDVANHVRRFAEWAERTGAAVVLIHHANKQIWAKIKEGHTLTDLVRGSGAWVDSVRMAWLMVRNQQDTSAGPVLVRIKTNFAGVSNRGGYRVKAVTREWKDPAGDVGEVDTVTELEPLEGSALELVKAELTPPKKAGEAADELADRGMTARQVKICDYLKSIWPEGETCNKLVKPLHMSNAVLLKDLKELAGMGEVEEIKHGKRKTWHATISPTMSGGTGENSEIGNSYNANGYPHGDKSMNQGGF